MCCSQISSGLRAGESTLQTWSFPQPTKTTQTGFRQVVRFEMSVEGITDEKMLTQTRVLNDRRFEKSVFSLTQKPAC